MGRITRKIKGLFDHCLFHSSSPNNNFSITAKLFLVLCYPVEHKLNQIDEVHHIGWDNGFLEKNSIICFRTKGYKIVLVNGTLVCFTFYLPVMHRIGKCPECYSSSSKSIRKSVRFSESSMASFSDISPFFDFFCKAARSWHNFCVLYIHQERQHKRCRFIYG